MNKAEMDSMTTELRAAYVRANPDPHVYWDDDVWKAICTICDTLTGAGKEPCTCPDRREYWHDNTECDLERGLAEHVRDAHPDEPMPSAVAGLRFDGWLEAVRHADI